jgi:hypothetical protein
MRRIATAAVAVLAASLAGTAAIPAVANATPRGIKETVIKNGLTPSPRPGKPNARPGHPDALRSRAELALVCRQLGRYGDGRTLLRDTVDHLQRIVPHDDPLIIELREVLADIGDE